MRASLNHSIGNSFWQSLQYSPSKRPSASISFGVKAGKKLGAKLLPGFSRILLSVDFLHAVLHHDLAAGPLLVKHCSHSSPLVGDMRALMGEATERSLKEYENEKNE